MRRVLLIWFVLFAFCATAVVASRLRVGADRLGMLGFGICSSKQCWQGIRPGLDWATVRSTFPDGLVGAYTEGQRYLMVDMAGGSGRFATIYANGNTVQRVNFRGTWEPIRLREIILHFGSPRCVEVGRYTGVRLIEVAMIYPTLRVNTQIPVLYDRGAERYFFQIAPNVRLVEIQFMTGADTICDASQSRFVFPWRGFQANSVGRE
jgi:hypothetical protein